MDYNLILMTLPMVSSGSLIGVCLTFNFIVSNKKFYIGNAFDNIINRITNLSDYYNNFTVEKRNQTKLAKRNSTCINKGILY